MTAEEARRQLAELLNRVQWRGERVVITRNGKPAAAIVPLDVRAAVKLTDSNPSETS